MHDKLIGPFINQLTIETALYSKVALQAFQLLFGLETFGVLLFGRRNLLLVAFWSRKLFALLFLVATMFCFFIFSS